MKRGIQNQCGENIDTNIYLSRYVCCDEECKKMKRLR